MHAAKQAQPRPHLIVIHMPHNDAVEQEANVAVCSASLITIVTVAFLPSESMYMLLHYTHMKKKPYYNLINIVTTLYKVVTRL